MATNSPIEWTEATWNPLTGCTKISPGCKNCYAERMSKRLQAMGTANYVNGFQLTLHRHALELPLSWKKPQRIFVNSMSDLFHKDVPDVFVRDVFDVMRRAHWHQFQVLTKRAERVEELSDSLPWPANVWQGVSVENADYTFRVDHLRRTGAAVKFLSVEPLLGPIDELDLTGIDWVIVGGESGPGCRPMRYAWVKRLQELCKEASVPMFFKQTGEKLAREEGYKSRKGCDAAEWPKTWRVREFPSLPVVK
jgi:protein gp37